MIIKYYIMSKICVFGDVHGNYPALRAVVKDTDADKYICTGDILGLMGYPHKTTALVKSLSDISVIGNHDVSIIHMNQGLVSDPNLSQFEYGISKKLLTSEDINWFKSKDSYVEKHPYLVAHAQPFPDNSSGLKNQRQYKKKDFVTLASNVNENKYKSDDINYILKGHTHQQAHLDCSKFGYDYTIVNPGSVGQITTYADKTSSDINEADYSIIDTDKNKVYNKSVEYDFEKVINRLNKLNAPDKIYKLLDNSK